MIPIHPFLFLMSSSPFAIRPFASENEQNSAIEALLPYLENTRQELLYQYNHYLAMHKQDYYDQDLERGEGGIGIGIGIGGDDDEIIRDMHLTLSESDAEQKRKDLELIDSVGVIIILLMMMTMMMVMITSFTHSCLGLTACEYSLESFQSHVVPHQRELLSF